MVILSFMSLPSSEVPRCNQTLQEVYTRGKAHDPGIDARGGGVYLQRVRQAQD